MKNLISHLPLRAKAFAASTILLLCLVALGSSAYVALGRWSNGLEHLSRSELPEQNELSVIKGQLSAIQLNVFRYVAWSSNGVDDKLRQVLSGDISADIDLVSVKLKSRTLNSNSVDHERWSSLYKKWKKFADAVRDTINIGRVDPAMGTMMLIRSSF